MSPIEHRAQFKLLRRKGLSPRAAMGLTGSGRLTENIGIYIGAGSDSSFKEVGGKAGVSIQW